MVHLLTGLMNRLARERGQARPGSLSDDNARSSVYVMKLKKFFIFDNARLCNDGTLFYCIHFCI